MCKYVASLVLIAALVCNGYTQERDSVFVAEDSGVSPSRVLLSTAMLGASITGVHLLQYYSWWKDQRGGFHVYNDPDYKANFDKFGHTFGAYYTAHFFDEAFQWSGFHKEHSPLMAGLAAAFFELYVEIEDGMARDWGFSPGDMKANLTGATFYVLRNTVPFMQNFQYKWIYFPSKQLLNYNPDIPGQSLNPIDDYGGQSYWITANINGLLPSSAKGIIPDWLNLGFGIGGYHLDAELVDNPNPFINRKKAYYIGLDYDLDKIIPESNFGIINFIRRGLAYWHFPAPAYRISPEPAFFILFPFQMTIK
jgi:hypothetical protein